MAVVFPFILPRGARRVPKMGHMQLSVRLVDPNEWNMSKILSLIGIVRLA
jgi:hypothetical protein